MENNQTKPVKHGHHSFSGAGQWHGAGTITGAKQNDTQTGLTHTLQMHLQEPDHQQWRAQPALSTSQYQPTQRTSGFSAECSGGAQYVRKQSGTQEGQYPQKGRGRGQLTKVASRQSFHSQKSDHSSKKSQTSLPIEKYDLDKLNVFIHTDKKTKEEYVVILKRSMKTFMYHADNYYRDKGSKRNNYVNDEKPADQDLKKFHKNRYYLFSKYDRGIKIDDESWYSITPETVAKHVANRIASIYGEGQFNAMDGFAGVGGNLIQLARKSGFAVGNDFDALKCEYAKHNAAIYNVDQNIQFLNKDFLKMKVEDIQYPANRTSKIDVLYMSPPWGGIGYNMLQEYSVSYLYPSFCDTIKKSLEFSRNLIFFLPKNTSIEEIIDTLHPHAAEFSSDSHDSKMKQIVIEVEQIVYGTSCKGIHIYTGDLVQIDPKDVVDIFYEKYCHPFSQDETYLKVILGNIFELCGYQDFIQYFKKDPSQGSKISLQKVIKKIQQKFTEEEWNYLKKYHKKARTNSRLSSTLSQKSQEEGKHSDTSSIASGKRSNTSSQKQSRRQSKSDSNKFAYYSGLAPEEFMQVDQEMVDEEGPQRRKSKKVVHFDGVGQTQTHIELRDLKEKDFLDLIEAKNQDKRFYGWLHFGPIFEEGNQEIHYKVDPLQDIEYFRQLYDNNLFTSFDSDNLQHQHQIIQERANPLPEDHEMTPRSVSTNN